MFEWNKCQTAFGHGAIHTKLIEHTLFGCNHQVFKIRLV